nr:MAG TPA: hypothetical protein [Caudoviricetes sp.]
MLSYKKNAFYFTLGWTCEIVSGFVWLQTTMVSS